MTVATEALDRSLSRLDSVVFRTDTAAICTFRCAREDPMFEDSGPIGNAILVFPRTITGIRQEGGETYVGNPNRVGFYNAGQEYVRWPVSKRGDRSDWYWVREDVLEEIVRRYDPSVEERPGRPFPFAWAPVDARVYFEQRRAWTDAVAAAADALELEERILRIADRAIAGAYAFRGGAGPARSVSDRRRRAELVESALEILSRQTGRATTLTGIARELSVSPFHLSRTFARHTGSTLAAHRGQLRLALALERLRDPRAELTVIAQDLGYSSHSHFTMAFRQAFGTTPSEFRRARG